MRLFISGGISGIPDYRSIFMTAEHQLRLAGYDVFNPAENLPKGEATWQTYMRMSLRQLLNCDGVAYLDGWMYSKGAQVEISLAADLEIPTESVWYWINDVDKG